MQAACLADEITDAVLCQAGACSTPAENADSEILQGVPLVALLLEPSPEFAVAVLACFNAGYGPRKHTEPQLHAEA